MAKKPLLPAVVLAMLPALGPVAGSNPVVAQEDGSFARFSPEYRVTEDGELIIGGDDVVQCDDLPKFGSPPPTDLEARAATEQSER